MINFESDQENLFLFRETVIGKREIFDEYKDSTVFISIYNHYSL